MTKIRLGETVLDSNHKTLIMGILNVTPDSFSDGGKYFTIDAAVKRAQDLVAQGADIIDVGGESTRPGAKSVNAHHELHRVIPVIEEVVKCTDVPVSVDTYKAEVAEKAIDAGAVLVNDITAMQGDSRMVNLIADRMVHVCLMHMKGTPQTMQINPSYNQLVREISLFLKKRAEYAQFHGIPKDLILFDPGIGFGKRTGRGVEDNCEILHHLAELKEYGYPIIVGASRKKFIGNVCGKTQVLPVEQRLEGSIAAAVIAAYNGADILRVHDVIETRRAVDIVDCILGKKTEKMC